MSGPGLISTSIEHNKRRMNSQRPTDIDGRRRFAAEIKGHAEIEKEGSTNSPFGTDPGVIVDFVDSLNKQQVKQLMKIV